jgi:hypothetical protein
MENFNRANTLCSEKPFNVGGVMKLPWFWFAVLAVNVAMMMLSFYMLVAS